MTGRRTPLLVLAALVVASLAAVQIESTTHVRSNGGTYLAFGLMVVWAFVIAGLIAGRRRPGNRTGLLMIAVGFAWLAAAMTDSPNNLVFTIGLPLSNLWPPLLIHLLLAYPSGRLDHRSHLIVIAAYVDTVVISTLLLPFSEPRLDATGDSVHSAHNLLLVSHQPGLISAVQVVVLIVAVVVTVACLVTVWQRWRAASAATRRVLAPMYLTGGVAIAILLVTVSILQVIGQGSLSATFYVFSISFTAIPVGYLFGILRTRLDRATAVQTLLTTLRGQRAPGGLRDALRVALNDATLDLAYRRRGSEEYLDVSGEHFSLPSAADDRAITTIEHGDEVVAAIVHDPFLLEDPGVIDAVCTPAALAIENERLQAELRARFQEVSASERRLRELLENVHLAAVSLDLDGRITFCNQFLADLSGWTRQELIGSIWLEIFPSGDPHYLDRVRQNRIRVHDDMPFLTRAGDRRTISWSNTLDRDADGKVVGSTSIGEDITDRARGADQEAALRRLATMVAGEAPPDEIFHTVTEEVAHLLGGQTANLVRFDPEPGTGTVVGGWSEPEVNSVPVGEHVRFDGPTSVAVVLRTGRTARIDDYTHIEGELAERLRGIGLRSSVAAPITVDGRMWGAITVSTIGTATLALDAEARLGQFTDLVALGLSSAEARSQLAASRARIVAAGDAERRRLERNLHDGAQQRLVSLSLDLRMARSTVAAGSETARLLESASGELMEALEELRELARGIHPAVLTDQGLRAAIRALTGRSTVPVSVSMNLDHELAPQVEAAVYYVIAEALTNVTKYARAASATVTISSDDAGVQVSVADDGVGGADPAKGSGLSGLTDRVEALGGRLGVLSSPAEGTRVSAWLPVTVSPEPAELPAGVASDRGAS